MVHSRAYLPPRWGERDRLPVRDASGKNKPQQNRNWLLATASPPYTLLYTQVENRMGASKGKNALLS